MIAPARPAAPGWFGRVWNATYELGYTCLRVIVEMVARPLFLVRAIESAPSLPSGPFIVCANHASYLDPVFVQLVLTRRIVFVVTNDFYRRPMARWFFKLVGAIPVDTGRLAKTGMERAVALLRDNQPVAIFPEGRLSIDGTVGDPQRGIAILARMGQAPVLPLGIDGNRRAWPKGARWLRRADVRLAFGPVIPPPPPHHGQARTEQMAFAERVMDAVREARSRAIARRPA